MGADFRLNGGCVGNQRMGRASEILIPIGRSLGVAILSHDAPVAGAVRRGIEIVSLCALRERPVRIT